MSSYVQYETEYDYHYSAEYYLSKLSNYLNHAESELLRLVENLHVDNSIKNSIRRSIEKDIKVAKDNLKGKFASHYDMSYPDVYDREFSAISLHFSKWRYTLQDIISLSKTYKNKKLDIYEALLDVGGLPQEVYDTVKAEINKIRTFEKEVGQSFQRELESFFERKIEHETSQQRETDRKHDEVRRKIEDMLLRIQSLDGEYFEKHIVSKGLIDRLNQATTPEDLELFSSELKLHYIKLRKERIESEAYRKEILLIAESSHGSFKESIKTIAHKKLLTEKDLEEAVNLHVQSLVSSDEGNLDYDAVIKSLESKGYSILHTDSHGLIYLDTSFGEEYKVRLKFEGGKISIQFVRFIEGQEAELSEYEKQVDIRKAKEFCQNLDSIIASIQERYGIMLDISKRIEPEERMFYIRWEDVPEVARHRKEEKRSQRMEKRL